MQGHLGTPGAIRPLKVAAGNVRSYLDYRQLTKTHRRRVAGYTRVGPLANGGGHSREVQRPGVRVM